MKARGGAAPSAAATLPFAGAIDESRPWLAPYALRGRRAAQAVDAGSSVAQALQLELACGAPISLRSGPLAFVSSQDLPLTEPYEAFIARSAQVPTRNNLHDFFNGIVWLHQPALKRRLNELQAAEIARLGIGPRRGALRDALTLFDENGALLDAPAPLAQALIVRDWQALFISHRALWAEARLTLVGHALLEQLSLAPRKGLTAHVVIGDALALAPEAWATKPFLPLPVLGVPGWWPANEAPGYYDDPSVFRKSRGTIGP